MEVRILAARDETTAEAIWTGLERRVGTGSLTTSWAWTSIWLRHYGDAVSYRFAVVERAGEPVAAVLLTTSRRGPRMFPVRRLHLGTAGEPEGHGVFVEYNDLLCAPEDRPDVIRALIRSVRELPGWDELDLHGFRADTAAAIGALVPLEARDEKSWTMRLQESRTVRAALSGSTRRLVRQAEETLQPGRPELAADLDTAQDILVELTALHQARWTSAGRPGAFASARLSGFVADLTRVWQPDGRVLLYRLSGGDGTIGCVIGFVEHDRFLYYQAGMRQYDDNRKRTGLLCHAVFAEDCRSRGLAEYEMLAGDAQYKRQLSGGEFNTLVWGRYGRVSVRARAVNSARHVRRTVMERRAAALSG